MRNDVATIIKFYKQLSMIKKASFLLQGLSTLVLLASCDGSNQQASDASDSTGMETSSQPVRLMKHTLTNDCILECVALCHLNHDVKIDVMAGAYWVRAPVWKCVVIFEGQTFDGSKGYSNPVLHFSMDVYADE